MLGMQRRLSTPFLVLLTLPATAMGFALSVQISALSWILSTKYGLDLHDIGLVWAAGPLAGIIGQVLIGILSDEVWLWGGRRRPFLIIGGMLAALMLLALPSIGVISEQLGFDGILGVAIAVAIALDLSINVSFNPTRSLITDVTPEGAERTRGYTWMQTVSGRFGVLAYAIGAAFGNVALIYVGAVHRAAVLGAAGVRSDRSRGNCHASNPPAASGCKRRQRAATDRAAVGLPALRHRRDEPAARWHHADGLWPGDRVRRAGGRADLARAQGPPQAPVSRTTSRITARCWRPTR